MKELKDSIYQIEINDHLTDLFESQYPIPHGVTYNSYLILDDMSIVLDAVESKFKDEWLTSLSTLLGARQPDYLLVHHVEPDHSGNIVAFMNKYPNATIVTSVKALQMINQFYGEDYSPRALIVKEGDTLNLGHHVLQFVGAPMVHWPEVLMTYDKTSKVLFSADGFGKFGALDVEEPWEDEARRYYFGIVGKFGPQVQAVLRKASNLEISMICPLHGPVLSENLGHYISLYDTWSKYLPEEKGTYIAYCSIYGNTKKAAEKLKAVLEEKGEKVVINDLARTDFAEAIANAFRYSKLVIASPTYNNDIFPPMTSFLHNLMERTFQNRVVGVIENGTWASMAEKVMKKDLETCRNLTFTEHSVHLKSAMNEANETEINTLAEELLASGK